MSRPKAVEIVVSLEGDTQEPLGTYAGAVEDVVRYRTLDNDYREAPLDCVAIVTVDALAGARPRPTIDDLEALHETLDDLIAHIDDEKNVPERYKGTAKATIARQDTGILGMAGSVVHRLMLWDRHPNVSPERYFAPGRGPSQ